MEQSQSTERHILSEDAGKSKEKASPLYDIYAICGDAMESLMGISCTVGMVEMEDGVSPGFILGADCHEDILSTACALCSGTVHIVRKKTLEGSSLFKAVSSFSDTREAFRNMNTGKLVIRVVNGDMEEEGFIEVERYYCITMPIVLADDGKNIQSR